MLNPSIPVLFLQSVILLLHTAFGLCFILEKVLCIEKESKQLGLFDIFCLGLGGAIGSGIFVMMGSGIAATGRSIFISVAFGCLFMLMAYFFHVVMSSMFVLEGGDYDMKAMLFNPTLTGVSAVFTMMGGIGFAMYGGAIADYASMVFPVIGEYTKLVGVGIITLFVIMGLPKVQPGFFDLDGMFAGGASGFIVSLSIMAFTCQGTTMSPIAMMSVTKNSKRTIPLGVLLITVCLALIYGLMAVVAAGVLPIEQVANKNLALVAQTIFPNWLYVIFIIGGAVFAIATSLISGIAMMRYPAMRVAQDGWLPDFFKKTTKSGYPWVIQLTFYLFSILPIIFGFSLDSIVSLTMIPSMLMCFAQNISLIKIVKKFPKQWNESVIHMPTPIFNVLCVIAGICDLIVAYNLFVTMDLTGMLLVVAMCVVCVVIALIRLKSDAIDLQALENRKQAVMDEAANS